MTSTTFPEANLKVAENQEEYQTLHAYFDYDAQTEGIMVFCWQLTWRERLKLLFTGKLWHKVLTCHKPLQPQHLTTDVPFER